MNIYVRSVVVFGAFALGVGFWWLYPRLPALTAILATLGILVVIGLYGKADGPAPFMIVRPNIRKLAAGILYCIAAPAWAWMAMHMVDDTVMGAVIVFAPSGLGVIFGPILVMQSFMRSR